MGEWNLPKDGNAEKIRTLMWEKKEAAKSEIARETGLSFPTVTRIVDAFCDSGEFLELRQGDSTGGRPSSVYGLNPGFSMCLLIGVEGSRLLWYVADLLETVVDSGQITFESGLLEHLDELIRKKQEEYPALKAISIGIAGVVHEGTVVESYAYTDMKGIDMPLHFRNLTDLPVEVNNDINLMALGQWYGCKEKPSSSVSILLGKGGFGAGVILNGEVLRGSSNFAGEVGFLPFPEQKMICAETQSPGMDVVEYYARLIQVYAAILNPEQVVLYSNVYIANRVDEVRQSCYRYLPEKGIPYIKLSEQFQEDYEKGLYAIASRMMRRS